MGGKGAAPVLGLVLLIGFVVAGALAVFAVGASVVDSSQSDVEETQVERAMIGAADRGDDIASGKRSSADWSFDGAGEGTPRVNESAGRINVTQYVDGQPEQVVVDDAAMGTLTYEHDDVTYAYQAGGVWRLDDGGEPQLVRAPELHYQGQTLTFPFVNVTGDVTAGQTAGTMEVGETKDVYPDAPTHYNPLRGGTIVLEVKSEYCEGWQSYFDQRTDGALIERCSETDETVDGEVQVELVVPFTFTGADHSILTEDLEEHGSPDIEDEKVTTLDVPIADRLIRSRHDDCGGSYGDSVTGTVDEDRLYCVDDWDPNDVVFDTAAAGGDIEVYVDDEADLHNMELDIVGNHDVTVFLNGSADVRAADLNCDLSGGDCQATPSQFRVFVVSDELFGAEDALGTPVDVGGFVYGHDAEVEFRGDVRFEGTIVANVTAIQGGGGSVSVSHHESMEEMDIKYDVGGKSVYYLHVTETEIEFTGS